MEEEVHRKRNTRINAEGHGHFLTCSCLKRMPLLTNDTWRTWLAESLARARKIHNFALWAYVFMPEHIHLLLKPRNRIYDFAKFEQSFKQSCSRRIFFALRKMKSPLLEKLRVVHDDGSVEYRFWQPGAGHDLNLWSMKKVIEKAKYCHWNPIKRRLVKSPDHWRWSSFSWIELGRRENQPVAVDDWDERLADD